MPDTISTNLEDTVYTGCFAFNSINLKLFYLQKVDCLKLKFV